MRIAVCRPQVPFVYGGAEVVADQLVDELRVRGHEVELVAVPYAWDGAHVLDQAFIWRLLDLNRTPGKPIDLVIATKFPSYGIRHPNKVVWLVHQFRQAYDFDRTEFGQFSESPLDRATRLAVERFDRVALGEAKRIFTISGNVADRLKRYTGLDATVLPPPPQKLDYRTDGYDGFVLSVNRLDRYKRIDLLIEAAKAEPGLRIVIVGDGPDRGRLEKLASGLNGRVEFTGRVDGDAARRPLRPLPRRLLRAGRRGLRDGPLRGVPVREAGRHDGRRRRAARGRPRRRDRGRRRARAGRAREGLRPPRRPPRRGEARSARPARRVAERITWDACIDALLS